MKLCECGCGEPAPLAKRSNPKRGYVVGEPIRFINGHQSRNRPTKSREESFWQYVTPLSEDECWEWQGPVDGSAGYGCVDVATKTLSAHRLSYELHFGPIPDNLWVLHKCDNPMCVNPAHLWLGTCQDNNRDKQLKMRQVYGERVGTSKLKADEVRQIRSLFASGLYTKRQLGSMFGVTRHAIYLIVARRNWKYLDAVEQGAL